MNKILQWTIKLAGAAICMPVTWYVSGEVFVNIGFPPLVFFMQVASLALVEGVFLSAWWMLDNDKQAPQEVKSRYVITVLVMYVMLWLLALSHSEGIAGIALRASLGLAIAGSVYESGVMTALRLNAAADRDINHDRKVKKEARNAAKADRILEIKLQSELNQATLKMRFNAERETVERSIAIERNHRMQELKVQDAEYHKNPTVSDGRLNNGNPRYPVHMARKRKKAKAEDRQNLIASLLADNPDLSRRDLVSRVKETTGVSSTTAGWDVRTYYETREPSLSSNGNGHLRG